MRAILTTFTFLTTTFALPALAFEDIKLSSDGICYAASSPNYKELTNYKLYFSLEECLENDGRLPSEGKSQRQFSRGEFGSGWIDKNGDCRNTRAELLISTSVTPVRYNTNNECRVTSGHWISTFTGNSINDANKADVTHVVPLEFAWEHGAIDWTQNMREDFANDTKNLLVVERKLNQSKSSKDLTEYLPPQNRCSYILKFIRVTQKYPLQLPSEKAHSYEQLKNQYCGN
ncbi:hypothetical protein A6E01_19935 (plasmid) [Vibrio breoganii]|uniref:GmrSD restriction endonucleases C-terminal domain-containing protein n=3 Tax=Vibrio TaxID=662 RepID=A0AAN0XZV8_9VIBR|nr:hypothetical protein A6E01_19935 [Vibrio breoganii]PML13849.1 hypothetical protein BCT84_12470 [Vibrio breoganii]